MAYFRAEHVSIYALQDPRTGLYHWVGKSYNPHVRYKSSLHQFDYPRNRDWIHDLKVDDLKPTLVILEKNIPWRGAGKVEIQWMKRLIAQGHPLLNNAMPVSMPFNDGKQGNRRRG